MAPDVIVVGAGVMGCASALRLQQAGFRTLVLERSVPGAEASSAAAGMLAATVEADHPALRPHAATALGLGRRSRALHVPLAEELRAEHGVDVGRRDCGALRVAFDAEAEAALDACLDTLAAHAPDEVAERLTADEARALEPALAPEVRGAVHVPGEGQLDPPVLLRALALAAVRAGATFRSGALVSEVVVENERCRGVRLGAERLGAAHVVVAAGSWTSLVPGLGLGAAGVHPVRGQVLLTESRPPLFRRLVFGAHGYVCTRPDGRVLCGSTEERVGFRREATLGGLRSIVDLATRLAPRLADAPVRGQWSSFRPGTADGLPLVGPAGPEGLWLASGHFRNGILLSAVTAELLTAQLAGDVPLDLARLAAPLDPRRFA
ncbi:MAG: FAD-dependent oxidoreductase [Myxococcota bacterium]